MNYTRPYYYRPPSKSTVEKRKAEYAEKYKKYIDWFNSLDPASLRRNQFLSDLHYAVSTGERPFSEKMAKCVEDAMAKGWIKTKVQKDREMDKIQPLLDKVVKLRKMIEVVDKNLIGNYTADQFSSYRLVMSMENSIREWGKISPKQMRLLNKKYAKYLPRYQKKIKAERNLEK